MPAKSKKQRRLMAIAEHHPEKLQSKNASVLKMSKQQLHDFAATSESKLPKRKGHHSAFDGSFISLRKARFDITE